MRIDDVASLAWPSPEGLLPAVIQPAGTGAVLMLGYMNRAALCETLSQGRVVFYSRSREKLWLKGESSGHFLDVVSVTPDCDSDTLLLQVRQIGGAACHDGFRSCFYRKSANGNWKVVAKRVFDPREVYKK